MVCILPILGGCKGYKGPMREVAAAELIEHAADNCAMPICCPAG